MKLSPVVLKLRLADTRFGNRIAGTAQIEEAFRNTTQPDMAFVTQLNEEADRNKYDSTISQIITERFGIVVALANDSSDKDKTGLTAYDSLYTVRSQLFSTLLGWQMDGAASLVCYRGGRLLGFNKAYLWYMFIFEVDFSISDSDGTSEEATDYFNTIYAELELIPSENIPYDGNLPVRFTSDMTQRVDLTINPDDGAFDRGFGSGFDLYTGD